jgi:hypothetical protein
LLQRADRVGLKYPPQKRFPRSLIFALKPVTVHHDFKRKNICYRMQIFNRVSTSALIVTPFA